jgi:ribonuclease R
LKTSKKKTTRKNPPSFRTQFGRRQPREGAADAGAASQHAILEALNEAAGPLEQDELAERLGVTKRSLKQFGDTLRGMELEGEIVRNRAGSVLIAKRIAALVGRVEGHPDGFGFLIPDERSASPDVYLSAAEMRQVLHGDRVSVRVTGRDPRGRPAGIIVEVLERSDRPIVGRLHSEHGVIFVAPEDRRISQDILVPGGEAGAGKPGDVVTVELIAQPLRHAQPIGRVVEVLGRYADPGMEIEIALRKFDLPYAFSREAQAETRRLPDEVGPKDMEGRRDSRDLPFVTIDGETARDFDDAVCAQREGKGFRLWVAVADVSHYVREDGELDADAYERGTSVYFPRRVIPMLPEKLSNGLCSLNPDVPRLAMICEMVIGPKGSLERYEFYPSVIHSRARLTYTEVWEMLSAKRPHPGREAVYPGLEILYQLFKVLSQERGRRGAIDFETVETRMEFDAEGKIERIRPDHRNEAHQLIEECMLAANVCAGAFLSEHGHPALYRVHDVPAGEKVAALREFLGELGLQLPGGETPRPKDYSTLIEKIRTRPDFELLQTVLLRSLRQAVYSPENAGHFGLAYDAYVHFTSPIRRYPDLLTHRAIKAVLQGRRCEGQDWKVMGRHCSDTERRADEASRDVENWLKCYYMRDHIDGTYSGTVTGVAPFGLFVTLDEYFVDGLLHISELGRDYFQHDAIRHQLIGERTRVRYRLADRVQVKLVRVDLETRKIDFVLAPRSAGD